MDSEAPAGVHPAPIITRHHILNELERLSRDYEETLAFRSFLGNDPTSDELLTYLFEHNVMDEKLTASVRRKWGPAEGWLGDIHRHGVEKFKEAFHAVGRGGPYLSAHLLIGFPEFRILVHPTTAAVHMLAMCPPLPRSLVQNRAVNDPTFQSYLRGARDSIAGLLDLF